MCHAGVRGGGRTAVTLSKILTRLLLCLLVYLPSGKTILISKEFLYLLLSILKLVAQIWFNFRFNFFLDISCISISKEYKPTLFIEQMVVV